MRNEKIADTAGSDSVRRVERAAAALVAVACLSGCHTYTPAELRAVPVGQEVRLYLSRAAIVALPEDVQVNNNLYVAGRMEAQDADSVLLGIRIGSREPGMVAQDLRELVKVGSGQIVDVQLREFSGARTALTVGAGALAAGLIIRMIFVAESSEDVGDPDEEFSRVPVFTLPFRLPIFGP
jgi:hypothetical protein